MLTPASTTPQAVCRLVRSGRVAVCDDDLGLSRTPTYALAQDAHGYLWLGTEDGPVLFDGLVWAAPASLAILAGSDIRAFAQTPHGRLWIAADGTGLACVDTTTFRAGRCGSAWSGAISCASPWTRRPLRGMGGARRARRGGWPVWSTGAGHASVPSGRTGAGISGSGPAPASSCSMPPPASPAIPGPATTGCPRGRRAPCAATATGGCGPGR